MTRTHVCIYLFITLPLPFESDWRRFEMFYGKGVGNYQGIGLNVGEMEEEFLKN